MWLASRACDFASRPSASEEDKLVAGCMHSYATSLELMARCDLMLSESDAESFYRSVMTHLQAYGHLHSRSSLKHGKVPGRSLWLIFPKHRSTTICSTQPCL